jgi:hypothetical protein
MHENLAQELTKTTTKLARFPFITTGGMQPQRDKSSSIRIHLTETWTPSVEDTFASLITTEWEKLPMAKVGLQLNGEQKIKWEL